MRCAWLFILVLSLAVPALAGNPTPLSGTRVVDTGQPFAVYVKKLTNAIKANRMGIVGDACATCGAKSIGVTIPGNRVIMIFNPHFAVRMLKASVAAGVEAPLRLYVTERADGTARLSYRLPSHVFAPYATPDLDAMARELDGIFARIVEAAGR
ncbi:MAG: DUF302 domain-containing protein [Rhodospirillales bacterium]|nr:DUF302 domain-containing protein [Rhodospirillales bacterium]